MDMIKKEVILKTAICYWNTEDRCYVAESPFFPPVIAAEESPEKALRLYKNLLNPAYEQLVNDKVHGYRRGRPAKHGVELHIQVQTDTKKLIEELREELGISQGQFIDLVTFYFAKKARPEMLGTNLTLETTISELLDAMELQKSAVDTKHKARRAAS